MGVQAFRYEAWGGAAIAAACACLAAPGAVAAQAAEHEFTTSDGVRLHYVEAGPADGRTVVFVPGWTMPGWIFDAQIAALSDRWRVLALDPRGQGDSEVAPFGYTAERRGRDIAELVDHAAPSGRVVLVGWSLGVLEILSMIGDRDQTRIAGLILIDNSVGEGPPPTVSARSADAAPLGPAERRARRAAFVDGLFAHDPGADFRRRLTESALRMDPADEARLRAYDAPRERWRDILRGVDRPVLYVVRPRLREQAEALAAARPNVRVEIFTEAGHALFVDEAERFNALAADFLTAADWGAPR